MENYKIISINNIYNKYIRDIFSYLDQKDINQLKLVNKQFKYIGDQTSYFLNMMII